MVINPDSNYSYDDILKMIQNLTSGGGPDATGGTSMPDSNDNVDEASSGGAPSGGGIPFVGSKAASSALASTGGKTLGMDNSLLGTIIQGLFGLGGGLLGAGQPQQRQSFSGTAIDPVKVGGAEFNAIQNLGNALGQKAKAGVKLRGVAPSVPGLSVSDPALKDPSLLSYPGLNLPDDLFGAPSSGTAVPRRRT